MLAAQSFDELVPVRWSRPAALYPRAAGLPALPPRVRDLALYLAGIAATPAKVREWLRLLTAQDGGDVEVAVDPSGVVALRIGDDAWPVAAFAARGLDVRACRVCGCTDELGCCGGCTWAGADLCSQCQEAGDWS